MSDQNYTDRELLLVRKVSDLTADRDEWKRQHENLLAIRVQECALLNEKIVEIERLRARVADLESKYEMACIVAGQKTERVFELERMLAAAPAQTKK